MIACVYLLHFCNVSFDIGTFENEREIETNTVGI